MKSLSLNAPTIARLVRHPRMMLRMGFVGVALILGLCVSVARADVVAVVSSRSPITALTKNQIVDIFLGKRTLFPDGTSAIPIDQIEGSATRDAFYVRFAGMSPAQVKSFWSRIIFTGRGQPPRSVATGADTKNLLASNPNAIGYVEERLVDSSLRVVQLQ
jgi:ABC-type phosphate transport system substrate-binding protein